MLTLSPSSPFLLLLPLPIFCTMSCSLSTLPYTPCHGPTGLKQGAKIKFFLLKFFQTWILATAIQQELIKSNIGSRAEIKCVSPKWQASFSITVREPFLTALLDCKQTEMCKIPVSGELKTLCVQKLVKYCTGFIEIGNYS